MTVKSLLKKWNFDVSKVNQVYLMEGNTLIYIMLRHNVEKGEFCRWEKRKIESIGFEPNSSGYTLLIYMKGISND